MDGSFKALDARSGRARWKLRAGSGIVGFTGPGGELSAVGLPR